MLFKTIDILDKHNIVYHLEGGTLLGAVRDKDFLPWDHDVDISILQEDSDRFFLLSKQLKSLGFKVRVRRSINFKYGIKKNDIRIFKVKIFWQSVMQEFLNTLFFFKRRISPIALDIIVKTEFEKNIYWEAGGKIMMVPGHHYASYEEIMFLGKQVKVPNDYKHYLHLKYGDWEIPVKDWSCDKDEKTIIDSA